MYRRLMLGLMVVLGGWMGVPVAAAEPTTHDARIAALRQDLEKAIAHFQEDVGKQGARLDSRSLTYSAHYLLALGHPGGEEGGAEALIQKAFDAQDMDPTSPGYGTFPWEIGNATIKDANAVEFTIKPLGPVFLLYGDKLSDGFKHEAVRHLKAAAQGILHHKVGIDYTNIFLMKCANLYALGVILKDQNLEMGGIKGFREWFQYTRTHGISEYNSPTYANTQLSCLLQTYRVTNSPTLKKELGAALDYMWTDLAANTFLNKNALGGAQLAGPFSRTYDFVAGNGPFDRFLYAEGLRETAPAGAILVDTADPVINEVENGYRPDASILAIAKMPSRVLRQTFGTQPGQDRSTYLTADYAVGAASSEHGQQDRQISVSLAERTAGKSLCDISVVLEHLDSPYGGKRILDRSGHAKPTHLKNAAATVQDGGTVLGLLDLAPSMNTDLLKAPVQTLDTNIVFPANAEELLLDGKPLTLAANQVVPISAKSWLIVREGNAAVAMRIFHADAAGGSGDAQFFIKYDAPDLNAARLVAYHLNQSKAGGGVAVPDAPIRAGVLVLARECPSPAFLQSWNSELHTALLNETYEAGMWSVTFSDGPHAVQAVLNVPRHRVEHRAVNGAEYQPVVFTINGEDKTNLLPTVP
jgi:hypothetical protein